MEQGGITLREKFGYTPSLPARRGPPARRGASRAYTVGSADQPGEWAREGADHRAGAKRDFVVRVVQLVSCLTLGGTG
jgi:hypothetical protein